MSGKIMTAVVVVVGIGLFGLTVAASVTGWGVDQPKEQKAAATDDDDDSRSTRAYHRGHFYPFYGGSIRHAGSSGMSGGGFHGGK